MLKICWKDLLLISKYQVLLDLLILHSFLLEGLVAQLLVYDILNGSEILF